VAAPRPAAQLRPELQPQPQPQPEPVRTPSFADHQVAEVERETLFAEPEASVPQPTAAQQRTAPFGAPKFEGGETPRQPGEPSPDALRRLQAAVQNVPKAQPMVRPIAQAPREPERGGGRLTINSLIHKMTGQVGREQAGARPRAELEPRPAEQTYEDSERERVDIPAFLRRQAN
jgi:cell division protein FtsZ